MRLNLISFLNSTSFLYSRCPWPIYSMHFEVFYTNYFQLLILSSVIDIIISYFIQTIFSYWYLRTSLAEEVRVGEMPAISVDFHFEEKCWFFLQETIFRHWYLRHCSAETGVKWGRDGGRFFWSRKTVWKCSAKKGWKCWAKKGWKGEKKEKKRDERRCRDENCLHLST